MLPLMGDILKEDRAILTNPDTIYSIPDSRGGFMHGE